MATLEQRIAELQKKHEQEISRLKQEGEILNFLPSAIMDVDVMVHPYKLYDRVGSVHLRYQHYSSIMKGRQPSVADALLLESTFTPVPLCIYRDGCVGIRTATDPKLHEGNGIITPIAPFWLRFNAGIQSEMSAHFIGHTPAGLMEFKVEFSLHSDTARRIGFVRVVYEGHYSNHYSGPRTIASSHLELLKPFQIVNNARGATINYSSGSRTTVGEKILYYDSGNGEHANVTLADVLAP